ncbi:TonB-dependent receptor [Methylomonas sp. UP202]|uniref:TonB-dependent receptor n=1 Tax=Methylomonas sp. UP202 TaxID=3040943 RepID=UPI002479C9B9|nr:TonB-dependent receptor [Methylomonas sp. UP202]WGS86054.1 TonB-dependent receptor [Methylomonas sp. UP202]
MRETIKKTSMLLALPTILHSSHNLQAAESKDNTLADVIVSEDSEDGRPEKPSKTDLSTPKTKISKKDIAETNAVTTSDSIKFESGVFVRQRYIGDPNAPVGMRGSNPYQGGRVMVFMDGMPIWNALQYSFNGSPRWGLIGPGEIKSVDILSGPFSAEYSGNAMGGVINFNTLLPQKREVYTEATYIFQPYQFEGTSKNLQGFRTFGSYGDKFGDFSSYFSYNHLENEGQPMTTYNYSNTSGANGGALRAYTSGAGSVSGAYLERNPRAVGNQANQGGYAGQPRLSYGDSGVVHSVDDLYKWKGGYQINPQLDALFTVAFENLDVTSVGQTYLRKADGTPVYGNGSTTYNYNGLRIVPVGTNFGASQQNRQTLTLGGGLKGQLFGNWNTDTHVSYFDVLHDQTISSSLNPSDPNNTNAGQISDVDSMGWVNISTKFDNQKFFDREDLSFSTGMEYQHAKMFTSQYSTSNYTSTDRDRLTLRSGGATDTYGLFGQLSWRFIQDWDATFGSRLERWNVSDGIYLSGNNNYSPRDRQASTWSPKFSLGYEPGRWKFRYSVAKAYRFPLVGELFDNSNSLRGSVSLANSLLKPEDGTHHNLMGEYDFNNGYIRLNLFHENVRNAIYSSTISNSLLIAQDPATFGPGGLNLNASNFSSLLASIDEVEINGIDLTINQDRVFDSNFDIKLDTTILNSKILKNDANVNYVSKSFPLLPDYRANLLTTYHYGKDWDFSVGTRYQGRMYAQLDNKDLQLPYYAAFTESVYVDLKATYRFNNAGHISAGVDNINDYQAFFNHPLPQRTFFAQIGYKF